MARRQRRLEHVTFGPGNLDAVVAQMARLAGAGDGWINVVPRSGAGSGSGSGDDDRSTSLRFLTVFGGGGPGLQMCTWTPGRSVDGRPGPSSLGIAHVTGRRAVEELASQGVAIPAGWMLEQDHPNRGLVLRVPPDQSHEAVLAWALRALGALGAPAPAGGWRADVYLPAGK